MNLAEEYFDFTNALGRIIELPWFKFSFKLIHW